MLVIGVAIGSVVFPTTKTKTVATETITTSLTCSQSAPQSFLYLKAVSDSSMSPVRGVAVSGSVKWLCGSESSPGYFVASALIGNLATPSNGTVFLGSIIGNYTIFASYSSSVYSVVFSSVVEQIITITLALPSGRITAVGCIYGGATCFNETNPSNETMLATT